MSNFFRNKYFLSLLSNGSNALIGMLSLTLLFRSLSIQDMGEYGFFLTVLLFFDTFRSGFLSTAFINFYSGTTGRKKDQTAGSAWIIATCITFFFLCINGVTYLFVDQVEDSSIKFFLNYFGIIYTLSLPFFMANCVLQAKQLFDKLLIINLTNQGSFLVFIIIAMLLGKIDVAMVIYCYMAANLLSSVVALVSGWTLIGSVRFATRLTIKELFDFGKYSVGTNITTTLMGLTSTFTIKLLLGAAPLAIFNAGSKLVQLVELPLRSVVFAALPVMSETYNRGDKPAVIHMMQRYIGVFLLAMVPVCLATIFLADYAILLLAGEKYVHTEAPNLLRIYMLITLLFPAERFVALTIDVFHLPKFNFIKVLFMIVFGVSASFLTVYLTGSIYAITLSSAVSYSIGLIFGLAVLKRHNYPIKLWGIIRLGFEEIRKLVSPVWKNTFQR